jgi:hypothetical protein
LQEQERRSRAAPAAVAIVALLSVLLFVSIPGQGLWYGVLLNASHGPIFAAVAALLMLVQPAGARSSATAYVNTFFVAIGLGILIEVFQTMMHRPGQSFDVITDAAGAAAGLGLWAMVERRRSGAGSRSGAAGSWWPLAIALAGITLVAWPPLQAARAYAQRSAGFPTLAQFQWPRDLTFVTTDGVGVAIVELPAPWARQAGERALRLGFDAQHSPAVQLVEPSPDWRGYSVLAADLTNPGDAEVQLTFRVLDAHHDWSHEDRLNLPLVLAPGTRTTVRVALAEVADAPASRSMDLAQIANVMLFGRPSPEPGAIYVSRLWLE